MDLVKPDCGGIDVRLDGPPVVVLIDDHPLIHIALRELVSRCTANVQLRCFRSVVSSLLTLREYQPALVLVDPVDLPDITRREAVHVVRRAAPGALVAIITDDAASAMHMPEVAGGLVALLDKSWHPEVTRKALAGLIERCGLDDVPCLSANVNPLARLSPKQQEVLRLLATGGTNQAIADALNLSAATVKTHVSQILAKLQVKNRTQAVLVAQVLQSPEEG